MKGRVLAYGVEIAPLSDYVSYDIDVVILITNPYNAMRITQGYAYHNGPIKNVQFSGMQALCEECMTRPFEKRGKHLHAMFRDEMCSAVKKMNLGSEYHLINYLSLSMG